MLDIRIGLTKTGTPSICKRAAFAGVVVATGVVATGLAGAVAVAVAGAAVAAGF